MIDSDEINDLQTFPISEEDRLINESKLLAFNSIKVWIENVSKKPFLYPNDFRKSLADGILLCNLLNCLKPGSIKRINKISTAIAGYDNIGKFLRCCEDDFGLSSLILFKTSDLEDLSEKYPNNQLESDKRLERVLICLFHLAKSVENQLTTFVIDSAPFGLLLKSQDLRQMKKHKTNSISDDTVFDSPVPEIMQKQVPNYLATKAQETLERTKVNKDMLNKSVENDDWQESLENWKERRRQALSQSLVDSMSLDLGNGDSKDLMKLKEKARQMKQLRDQIKDQNIQQPVEPLSAQPNASIPDIDDEMKAMIERVKQKKLEEEQKRKYSMSSPTITSFASDSEQSNSLAIEKPGEEAVNNVDKNEYIHPTTMEHNIIKNNETKPFSESANPVEDQSQKRVVQIKLSQRLKQDSNQLWGMELSEKSGRIIVSKVKIGSSADVCEVKKDDEIISINSKNITAQSLEYAKSVFDKYASVLSSSDHITLTIRRLVDDDLFDDEDEDFLSETEIDEEEDKMDGKNEMNERNVPHKAVTENKINLNNIDKSKTSILPSKPNNDLTNTNKKLSDYKEESSYSVTDRTSTIRSEISNLPNIEKSVNGTESKPTRSSVQDRIAKFETQKLFNPASNLSKTGPEDSLLVNRKYQQQTSCPIGSTTLDNTSYKLTSNRFFDSDIPKMTTKPSTQQSSAGTSHNGSTMDLQTPEEPLETPNVNNAHSLKRLPSGNSSTSDDVSALNETIIMSQYGNKGKANNSTDQFVEKESIDNENNEKKATLSNPARSQLPVLSYSKKNLPLNTSSTGIQANLRNREPPAYTTITTSFENPDRIYNAKFRSSDEESSQSDSLSKPPNKKVVKSKIPKQHSVPHFLWQRQTNKNDMSKEFTSVTSVCDENDNKNKSESSVSLSIGSNISDSLNENDKTIEIEVSVTPQLFPMRNKTLLTRSSEDRNSRHKSHDSITLERSFDDDENTLKSDYIRVTNLDDVVSPVKEKTDTLFGIDNIVPSSVKEDAVSTVIKTKKFLHPSAGKDPQQLRLNKSIQRPKSECFDLIEPNNDIDTSLSTVPAPTLFKSSQKSDNTLSLSSSYSKSETVNTSKTDTTPSNRKPVKTNNLKNNDGFNPKRSSSTKDLSYLERGNSNDRNRSSISTNRDIRKQSASQVTFSNIVQDITETKSQTKTVSVAKSTKNVPVPIREKKKPKSPNRKSCPAEISTKCNNCSQPAGSEDLMVIEELNLHFHLRCFTCSECKVQLGDGKSDADVRIRRSKLHCTACYNRKSAKSKQRNSLPNYSNQSLSSNIQTKGGR